MNGTGQAVPEKRIAVIGIGNILMGDDGAGVRVLELLPPHIRKMELATGGMSLLHLLDGLDTAIIADAVDFGGEPGEVRVFRPGQVKSVRTLGYSLHDVDILKVLELARELGQMPDEVFIAAVQPASVCHGEGLSPEVEGALGTLARRIVELAETF